MPKTTNHAKPTDDELRDRAPHAVAALTVNQREQAIARIGGTMTLEQVKLLKDTICRDATDDELRLFVSVCGRTGLDPFAKQIYFVKRYDSKLQREVGAIQIGIDGFRLIAQRTGKYAGQDPPQWCGDDGVWRDVWLTDAEPAAARIAVYHSDFPRPVIGMARWKSYVQTYKDKQTGKLVTTHMWERMDAEQLAKCAEAQALRRAFPQDLADLYSDDELREIKAPRDLRHAPGVARAAEKSTADVLDATLAEPNDAKALDVHYPEGTFTAPPLEAEPNVEVEVVSSLEDPVDIDSFMGLCKQAQKALGRVLVKEGPPKSGQFWFVDQQIVTDTLLKDEVQGSVHLLSNGVAVIKQDRLLRLHAGVKAKLDALAARTA